MSRITYTPVSPGDTRDAAQVNTIFNAIATASAAIDGENFPLEALDRSAVTENPYTQVTSASAVSRTANVPVGAWTQLNIGTAMRTGSVGLVDTDEHIRIRSWVWFETTLATGQGLGAGRLQMRHAWNDGTTTAAVPGSTRARTHIAAALSNLTHGNVMIESWLSGSIANVAWVEIQYQWSGGANIYPSTGVISVDRFRRMGTF